MERQNLLMTNLLSPKSSERRPSRRFTSLVDQMKKRDQALQKLKQEKHPKILAMEELLNQKESIQPRMKNKLKVYENLKEMLNSSTGQSTEFDKKSAGKFGIEKEMAVQQLKQVEDQLESPKIRKSSLDKERCQVNFKNIKLPLTPGNNTLQLKKLAFFKKDKCIGELDKIINEALKDLKYPLPNKLKEKVKILPSKSKILRIKLKEKNDQFVYKIGLILFCLITLMVSISRI